ncbi:MAG: hypothetical protein WDA16_12005 [Candidatus Thermoplasmatota archaeon]
MRHAQEELSASSSPLVTLTISWAIVVGLAFAPIGLVYYRTGDLWLLLAFAAAALIIGTALVVALWLGRAGARGDKRARRLAPGEVKEITDLHKRGALFGKR